MKSNFSRPYIAIILSCLALPYFGFSQEQNEKSDLRNKVGIGGGNFTSNEYFITASYNRILNKRNELEFPIYYRSYGYPQEIIIGAAFNWALIKRETRFNLFFTPEIQYNNYWNPNYTYGGTESRYGFLFCLGFIPSYKISNRFSLAIEAKVGLSLYQWTRNAKGTSDEFVDETEYVRAILGLKLYYHF